MVRSPHAPVKPRAQSHKIRSRHFFQQSEQQIPRSRVLILRHSRINLERERMLSHRERLPFALDRLKKVIEECSEETFC
jgi:hypothetical protein